MGLCRDSRQRRILGVLSNGQPFYVIRGREPGDENEEREENEQNGESENSEEDGSGSQGGGSPRVYSQEDVDAIMKRLSGADKARTAAEQKVKEFENASRTELEKAQAAAKEYQDRYKAAAEDLKNTRIQNKFFASNKHEWHDPETALALLDISDVTIDDDGKVEGIDKAIEALAKAKPFLLKSKSDKDETGGKGSGKPSGTQPPANGGNRDRTTERNRLVEKYGNALRR